MQLNERQVHAIAEAMVGTVEVGCDSDGEVVFRQKAPELFKALEVFLGTGQVPDSTELWSVLIGFPAKPKEAIPSAFDLMRARHCIEFANLLVKLGVHIGMASQAVIDREPKEGADVHP